MTQDERWLVKYKEVMGFLEENHRNPSRHRIEEHDHRDARGQVSGIYTISILELYLWQGRRERNLARGYFM